MPGKKLIIIVLVAILMGGLAGCGSAPVEFPSEAPPPVAPEKPETSDQVRLKEALTGRELPSGEVADLSDRFLARGNEVTEQDMARLELILLKALKSPERAHRASLWRNLGIIHYHQRKYKQARQELQASNELNPKNARTHFYLARLMVHQGEIYERQGQKRKAQQQFKRAAIEMELARKIEPSNSLYRQNVKDIIGRDSK